MIYNDIGFVNNDVYDPISFIIISIYYSISIYQSTLCRVGKKGWTFSDLLADFQLLLYLCQFLDLHHDIPYLCKAVTEREIPLDDGYQLLIRSIAGFD